LAFNQHNPIGDDMKATKKPVTIEYIEWTGENLEEVIMFTGKNESIEGWLNAKSSLVYF